MNTNSYLKTGWPFPPALENQGQTLRTITYKEDIMESLEILFTTLPGERLAHPLYGCDLLQYMFRLINQSLLTDMAMTIQNATTLFEPRIELIRVEVIENEWIAYQLDVLIEYEHRAVSARENITIPFYTMEQKT